MPALSSIAFVCPRLPDGMSAGGAEMLLKSLALRFVRQGTSVTFLTTCATDHFTWKNILPPGSRQIDGMNVMYFPVDARDVCTFTRVQDVISRGRTVTRDEEALWVAQSVNSSALCQHIESHRNSYDRIVIGPYLFGLIYRVAQIAPEKTCLVPCLHDEPFARLEVTRRLFSEVNRVLFNTEQERRLAVRLFGSDAALRYSVVGMGIDPFDADGAEFVRASGCHPPYLIYCGRREPLKGTPLLLDYMRTFLERTRLDLRLVLSGSGAVDIPAAIRPHVFDVGFLSDDSKRSAMAGALAFCHPSVNESLGIVALESWLARTPLLVHARSEVLVEHCRRSQGGLWFGSYPEFEESVSLLLGQPELRGELARNGRAYVLREYSWDVVEQALWKAVGADN